MRIKFKPIAAIVVFLLLTINLSIQGCVGKDRVFKDLSPREAFSIIQKNRGNPNFVILDVRTPQEFGEGHLEHAINLDFHDKNFRRELSRLDRSKIYLVYCQVGIRSEKALEIMKEINFKRGYHLPAGILGWEEEGLPLKK